MLKTEKDESLHSLIYRTHLLNGYSVFSNVLTINGRWCAFPKISNETLQYYLPINENVIVMKLRDIERAKITKKMFESPFSYVRDLDFFYGIGDQSRRNFRISRKVTYCLKCIKESINIKGHAFFNVTWLYNDFCFKHEISLFYPLVNSRLGAVKALDMIFKGKHPNDYSPCSNKVGFENEYFLDNRDQNSKYNILYMAPCLAEAFKDFILSKKHLFTDVVAQSIRFSISELKSCHMT